MSSPTLSDSRRTFRPEGELTIYTVAEQYERLMAACADADALSIDLSAVSELDTAGLQLLMLARREAARLGLRMRVAGCSDTVSEVLQTVRLKGLFDDAGRSEP